MSLTTADEQIFIPEIGFRPLETLIARTPVTRSAERLTVTVERAVAGSNGVDVVLTMTGPPNADRREMPRFGVDTVAMREPDGRVVPQVRWKGSLGRISGPPASELETIRRNVSLEALSPGTTEVELTVSGVTVPLTFEPGSAVGVRSHLLDARVERHGISVIARRIAFTPDSTALELVVQPDDARRSVYMVGMSLGPNACGVGLRDDAGRVHSGQRLFGDGHRRGGFSEVGIFPALAADVRAIWLEVATVSLTEPTEDLTLPVGFDGEFTLGGLTGRANVLRESEETRERRAERLAARRSVAPPGAISADERFGRLEVECGDGPWVGDRRLIRPGNLWLADRTRGCSMSYGDRGWLLSVPDPAGDASAVTISSAIVQYRGPWTLEVALPPRS